MADEIQDPTGKTTGYLKKKVGPLEVWQWAVGVVGLIAAYLAIRSYTSGTSTPSGAAQAAQDLNPISTVPPSGTNSGGGIAVADIPGEQSLAQIGSALTQPGGLPVDVTSVTAPTNSSASPSNNNNYAAGAANFTSYANSPAALQQAQASPSSYITAQYQEVLGRTPDAVGLQSWENQLGATPSQASLIHENQAFIVSAAKEQPGA